MMKLIGLIKPLLAVMLLAITMGVIGHLAATFLTIFAGEGLLFLSGFPGGIGFSAIIILLLLAGFLRGVFRYVEQVSNHFIAFKLLALIRNKIFTKLRSLAPAKLEGRDKGNLISIITGDIELLEVFYAHTISPIAIAILTSIIMSIYIGSHDVASGLLAAAGYLTVGFILPVIFAKLGNEKGQEHRDAYGAMNSYFLENITGIHQILQFNQSGARMRAVREKTAALEGRQKYLKKLQGINGGITACAVVFFAAMMFYMNYTRGLDERTVVLTTIAMMGSFGPTVALSALSGNLYHTIACGNRVLNLLEEEPVVREVTNGLDTNYGVIKVDDVDFSYADKQVIKNLSLDLPAAGVVGINGRSGCGKSTLLKLLMRFWSVDKGAVTVNGDNVEAINTARLRDMMSYVTQETVIFNDTIANNIAVSKPDASREEIRAAAKAASIDEFIMTLPQGYDTIAGELGDTLSGGEKQRIGIARAFLHDAPVLLLDEPTSNIDSLNEGIVLKSIAENKQGKLVIMVSHRRSTMGVCDKIVAFERENDVVMEG
ncbi:MAG: ABC transporter ATP-binding protein [Eubacteriales bacterium]|nr:ABC transporter ATP-binding protein [Eubacteriales bacterium]